MIDFTPTSTLPNKFEILLEESESEGFNFIRRLTQEWKSGENKFMNPNEVLFSGWNENQVLVCIGGITQDPYASDQLTGRLRRFYVRPQFRRNGTGKALLTHVLDFARPHYNQIQLRTVNSIADKFYQAFGFTMIDSESATHQYIFPA